MKFKNSVEKEILNNYTWAMINPGNRRNIVNFLNNNFFPDNIAEFIDVTGDLDIDMNSIGLEVKYKKISYKLSEFDNHYKMIERLKKLNKISGK